MVGILFSIIVFLSFMVMTITITLANIQDFRYNKMLYNNMKKLDKGLEEINKEIENKNLEK